MRFKKQIYENEETIYLREKYMENGVYKRNENIRIRDIYIFIYSYMLYRNHINCIFELI